MFLHLSLILFTGGGVHGEGDMCVKGGCDEGGVHDEGWHVWQRKGAWMARGHV